MKDYQSLTRRWFDLSLRIETLIHLGTMAIDYSFSTPAEEFFEDEPEEAERLLGCVVDESPDWEELSTFLYENGKLGFLVKLATPVPSNFSDDGSYQTNGWGHFMTKWFYTEGFDETFFETAEKWRDEFIKSRRKAALAK